MRTLRWLLAARLCCDRATPIWPLTHSQANEKASGRGRAAVAVHAAAVYMACRLEHHPRTFKEILAAAPGTTKVGDAVQLLLDACGTFALWSQLQLQVSFARLCSSPPATGLGWLAGRPSISDLLSRRLCDTTCRKRTQQCSYRKIAPELSPKPRHATAELPVLTPILSVLSELASFRPAHQTLKLVCVTVSFQGCTCWDNSSTLSSTSYM